MKKFIKVFTAVIIITAIAAGGFYAVKKYLIKPENTNPPVITEKSETTQTLTDPTEVTEAPYDNQKAFNAFKAQIESYKSTYPDEDTGEKIPTFTAYSLYDMDNDGNLEVIVFAGRTYHSADVKVLKYMPDEDKVLTVDFLENIHIGHCTLVENPEKNGIAVYYSLMGSVRIDKAELSGSKIELTEIHSSTDLSYGAENLDTGRRFVGDKQLALSNDEFAASYELLESVLLDGNTSDSLIDCLIDF